MRGEFSDPPIVAKGAEVVVLEVADNDAVLVGLEVFKGFTACGKCRVILLGCT